MSGNTYMRRLWLNITIEQKPRGFTRADVAKVLLDSLNSGNYSLPENLRVSIQWRNRDDAPMKEDDWTNAMIDSMASVGSVQSMGWEKRVRWYLQRFIKPAPVKISKRKGRGKK